MADAVPRLGVGGDDTGGDAGLLGVDGAHGGDLGDRGVDTLGDEVGVGEVRGRDVGVEVGDDGAVDSLGEKLEGVGLGGRWWARRTWGGRWCWLGVLSRYETLTNLCVGRRDGGVSVGKC